ncbi:9404_t:CDS:2, partial [Dentiscutata heterogama]
KERSISKNTTSISGQVKSITNVVTYSPPLVFKHNRRTTAINALSLSILEQDESNITSYPSPSEQKEDSTKYSIQAICEMSPPPKCFKGHSLQEIDSGYSSWGCDVCGKNNPTWKLGSCKICDFATCPVHCSPGQKCEPLNRCSKGHPLYNLKAKPSW